MFVWFGMQLLLWLWKCRVEVKLNPKDWIVYFPVILRNWRTFQWPAGNWGAEEPNSNGARITLFQRRWTWSWRPWRFACMRSSSVPCKNGCLGARGPMLPIRCTLTLKREESGIMFETPTLIPTISHQAIVWLNCLGLFRALNMFSNRF